MGCCISAGDRPSTEEPLPRSPSAEEETVKEVLVETVPVAAHRGIETENAGENLGRSLLENRSTAEIESENGNPEQEAVVSEASEIFSNYSNSAEIREEEEEEEDGVVDQRPPPRKRRAVAGRRRPGRSGVVTATEKRGQVAPPASWGRVGSQLENGGRGESSRRQSRSPVRRGEEKDVAVLSEGKRAAAAAEEVESLENPIVSLECFIFL